MVFFNDDVIITIYNLMSKIDNKVKNDKSEMASLSKSILLLSLASLLLATLLGIIFSNYTFIRSFLFGTLGSIFYLRMQVMFVSSFSKRDFLSILVTILSGGRILIILAVLAAAIVRTDLFNVLFVIAGLASVHLISISVFIYNTIVNYSVDKKKLVIN